MSAEDMIAAMTKGEKLRLYDGRTDWREDDWQDHCGDLNCVHCEGASVDVHITPLRLSDDEKAARALLRDGK